MRTPLRTTLHSLQNSAINSSDDPKSLAHTGVDANGALYDIQEKTLLRFDLLTQKRVNHEMTNKRTLTTQQNISY